MSVRTTALNVGDQVTYLGHRATVMHGYQSDDAWVPVPSQRREPTASIASTSWCCRSNRRRSECSPICN